MSWSHSIPVWNPSRLRRPQLLGSASVARSRTAKTRLEEADSSVNAEYVFTRPELQPVLLAIRASLGQESATLDSPFRLQEALIRLIGELDGRGDVVVRRSPAALLTPEYWQIVLTGLDGPTHASLVQLFRAGRQ
jgi:hypothetical protein